MKWILVTSVLLIVTGCKTGPIRHIAESPAVTVSDSGKVEVSGDAQTPSRVDTKKTGSNLKLPEGSRLEFNEKLGVFSVVLSKASEIAVNRTETAVQGPVAFTPDKGPTVGEEMEAKSNFWTVLGLRAALAAGCFAIIFGLVKDWPFVMYGGISMAGAALFGLFVQRHPTLMIFIGAGAALIVMATIIWHTKLKKIPPEILTQNG
jgi:hypothetical protein